MKLVKNKTIKFVGILALTTLILSVLGLVAIVTLGISDIGQGGGSYLLAARSMYLIDIPGMDWIQGLDSWVLFLLVTGAAAVVIVIVLFFVTIIYRLFRGSKENRGDMSSMQQGESFGDYGDYGSDPAMGGVGMPNQPMMQNDYGIAPPLQLSTGGGNMNMQFVPQIDAMYQPDMSNVMQLAPTVMHGNYMGAAPQGRISQAVYERLGFDLFSPFMPNKPEFSMTDETKAQDRVDWLEKEKKIITQRLIRVSEEYNLMKSQYDSSVQGAENDITEMQREILDLEQWLHQASKKEKQRILGEIEIRDKAIQDAHNTISEMNDQSRGLVADLNILQAAQKSLYEAKAENEDGLVRAKADIKVVVMRDEQEAPERQRKRAEKINRLRQIMVEANRMQIEDDAFDDTVEHRNKEKEMLKTENITLQHAILSTADLDEVVSVSEKIQYNNQAIMELDRKNNEDLKNRSVRPNSLNKLKRDAEGIIRELKLSHAEVVREEDEVLVEVARAALVEELNEAKRKAQDGMIRAQHRHDHLANEYHKSLTDAAFNISSTMREAEEEVVMATDLLKNIVARLAVATGPDANLLTIEKLTAEDAVQLARVNAERIKASSIRERIEAKAKLDRDIAEASKDIETARKEYDNIVIKQRSVDTEAAATVISGSGVVSIIAKESEVLEIEKEKARQEAQNRYDTRKVEIENERRKIHEDAGLESRLHASLQGDIVKAQNGDADARQRLENNLLVRMQDDEKQYFHAMRPDEKWRFMMMEVEEIIRRSQHTSKERLAALIAEEDALQAKLESDQKIRMAEESVEDAKREMDAQIAQAQIDADYARLQSMDTVIAAKELAEKQAEEIMRVAYEERRKATELIDDVKKRSLEARRQAEEAVKNSKAEVAVPNLEAQTPPPPTDIATNTLPPFVGYANSKGVPIVVGASQAQFGVGNAVKYSSYNPIDQEIAQANNDLVRAQADMERARLVAEQAQQAGQARAVANVAGLAGIQARQDTGVSTQLKLNQSLQEEFRIAELERQRQVDAEIEKMKSLREKLEAEHAQTQAQQQKGDQSKQELDTEQFIKAQVEQVRLQLLQEQQKAEQTKLQQAEEITKQVEKLRVQLIEEQQKVEQAKQQHSLEVASRAEKEMARVAELERKIQQEFLEKLEQERKQREEEREAASNLIDDAKRRVELAEQASKAQIFVEAREARMKADEASSAAHKQAQDAKDEALKVRATMEQELTRVRQELENTKKTHDTNSYVSAVESRAQAEVKEAIARAEKAEELARQAAQAELLAKQQAEQAVASVKLATEQAVADAVNQSKTAGELVQTIRKQTDQEIEQVKLELQKELSELKAARDQEIALRAQEYEQALMNAESIALERAEKAEQQVELTNKILKETQEKAAQQAHDIEAEAMRRIEKLELETKLKREQDVALSQEKDLRVANKVAAKKVEIAQVRERMVAIKTETELKAVLEKLNIINQFLDEDERSSKELAEVISRAMIDARHIGEMAILRSKLDQTVASNAHRANNSNPQIVLGARVRPPLQRRASLAMRPMRPMRPSSVRYARPGMRPLPPYTVRHSRAGVRTVSRVDGRPVAPRGYRRPPQ